MFWDHETREARERYPDFLAWFAGEFEPYLFDDDEPAEVPASIPT
jgi:hypothetical protein